MANPRREAGRIGKNRSGQGLPKQHQKNGQHSTQKKELELGGPLLGSRHASGRGGFPFHGMALVTWSPETICHGCIGHHLKAYHFALLALPHLDLLRQIGNLPLHFLVLARELQLTKANFLKFAGDAGMVVLKG